MSRAGGIPVVHAGEDVNLLVTAWLSVRRSESTRAGYARDIGITPPRRPGRAPSWLTWCREQGVHPVTGVTALHVARYARHLETAGLSPASAARKLAAISSWYAWLARRGHISASPAAGTARPRPGPRTPSAPALTSGQVLALINAADTAPGSQRARTAALTAVLLFAGARLSEVTGADVADLGLTRNRLADEMVGEAPTGASAAPAEGASAAALARTALEAAGFSDVRANRRLRGLGLAVDFTAADAAGRTWYFDIAGSNSAYRGGMARSETVWRALGRAHVMAATEHAPFVILTTQLPRAGTEPDRALRAPGPGGIFDVVDLLAPAARKRLRAYAGGRCGSPRAGFWTPADVAPGAV